MSVLRKKPFIEELLSELTVAEIERLTAVINERGTPETVSLQLNLPNAIPFSAPETVNAKIKLVNLFIGSNSAYTGILVYHSTSYCAFIGTNPTENDIIKLFKLDVTNRKAEPINEKLTADELRRVIDDTVEAQGGGELGNVAKVHNYSEGTTLTESILSEVKSGDIIVVDGIEFVVSNRSNLSPRRIQGKTLASYGNAWTIDWVVGNTLEAVLEPLDATDLTVQVELSTDGGSTYSTPIPLKEWIDKCENGDYTTVGTIARISNCINGGTFRFILIGINHDVLANTDAGEIEPSGTKAKTTWQFYDMPVQKVNLGLPYEEEKTGNIRSDQTGEIGDCPEVTIDPVYPSNMHGYSSATGLLDALQCVYNSMPELLRKAMKLVRKDCFISEIDDGDNFELFDSTASTIFNEGDRYGSCVAQKLFCLSAYEVGYVKGSAENPDFPTIAYDSEDNDYELEGSKYAYFEEGNESESALAKRIRYFNGDVWYYWLRSPSLLDSNGWGCVDNDGGIGGNRTYSNNGVAPAFCI